MSPFFLPDFLNFLNSLLRPPSQLSCAPPGEARQTAAQTDWQTDKHERKRKKCNEAKVAGNCCCLPPFPFILSWLLYFWTFYSFTLFGIIERVPQGSSSSFYVLRRIEKPHANKMCLSLLLSFEPGYRTQDPSLLCCLLVFVISIFQSSLVSYRPHSHFPSTRFCLILKYLQFCGFPLNAISTSTFIL